MSPLKSSRERAEEKRDEKLKSIDDAVAAGRLVVRQMTPEEREKYPPRPPRDDRKSRYGR